MSWPHGLLERLGFDPGRVRKGRFWYARCPAHDDRTPSYEAWLTPCGGRLLVGCWAGCDKRVILAIRGVKMAELFRPEEGAYGSHEVRPCRREVGRYDYCDEHGRVLYTVVRYEPKDFRQCRVDPDTGREVWGLGDARRVLYRTPELAARRRACVWVVEGERKADLLHRLGMLGTCAVGGTGMGWADGYAKQLTGRHAVVVPDNDAAGLKHAERVLGSLVRHGAASVRLAELPGLPDGGDVIDLAASLGEGGVRPALMAAGVTWRAQP